MFGSNYKLKFGIIGYGDVGNQRLSILRKYKQLNSKVVSDINDELALVVQKNLKEFNEQR